ncbi:hypothetical protein BGZ98_004897 [Dissophora globulifera]|nr:hypothetical protein BGZ98_004897 [Dissophora globulifera]
MAFLHTSALWTTTHLQSPTACKAPSIKLPPRPASAAARPRRPAFVTRSTSMSSIPLLATTPVRVPPCHGSIHSSPHAINIPSPPLTPHPYHDHENEGEDNNELDDKTNGKSLSLLAHPSGLMLTPMSPPELGSSSASTTGFTFSSNMLSPTQAKDERKSYDVFVNTMEEDYWKSVSTIRTTYFFDGIGRGGGFLAIPHIASHGNAKTNVICRLLEAWLTKKLVEPTISEDSIPVLEDNIESSVESIEQHLRQDLKIWSGISKSFIHIRCGHVFMLDTCCDDDTIVHLGADEFYQDYPLFVDVEIKMHYETNHSPKKCETEVLIAFQNVVNRNGTKEEEKPYLHRVIINGEEAQSVVSKRRASRDSYFAGFA